MSTPERTRKSDLSAWNLLLLVPIVIPLLTFLFNSDSPRLFGFPAFYWIQLAFVILGVVTTTIVYQIGKRKEGR